MHFYIIFINFENKIKTVMTENQPTTNSETEASQNGEQSPVTKPETPEEEAARIKKIQEEQNRQAKQHQKEMDAFYKEALPMLRRRAEYHRLMAEIPEDILRRVKAEHEHAQIIAEQREWQAKHQAELAKKQAEANNSGTPEA